MNERIVRRPTLRIAGSLLVAGCLALLTAGCGRGTGPDRVKVAYIGLTCEAAIFVAREKGFFQEEGLDVELVKTDWDSLRDGLGLGRFDANYTLIMYLLKPIEQGLDVKITGGVHTGCLRVQAGAKSDIRTVEDLRGKRIGIPTMGSPPFLFTSRVLAAHGMDPRKDVEWVVVAPEVMGLALDNGQVDAVADSEPLGSILLAAEKVRTVADQAADPPYRDEYCCATVVSGQAGGAGSGGGGEGHAGAAQGRPLGRGEPDRRGRPVGREEVHRGLAGDQCPGDREADVHPGRLEVSGEPRPGVAGDEGGRLLNPSTDPAALAQRAWLDLDGVTDDWVAGLKVETVAGGGPPPAEDAATLASMLGGAKPSCCSGK
jgi:NitT/TauT family transport system substrate-binding protein